MILTHRARLRAIAVASIVMVERGTDRIDGYTWHVICHQCCRRLA